MNMAELVNMSDQFKGLPMDSLIGGPLTAACDAQVRLANATADFIKFVGFEPPKDNQKLIPRVTQFKFTRPVERTTTLDNYGKPKGPPLKISQEEVELEVPLLALVRVPNLSITTVDVDFDMEVKSSFTSTEKSSAELEASADVTVGWGFLKAKIHIQGKVSSHKENTRTSDNSAKYHVAVHAEDRGMPEGLARVMDILQTSIAPKKIQPASDLKDDSGGIQDTSAQKTKDKKTESK
jgi:hypothetical protein